MSPRGPIYKKRPKFIWSIFLWVNNQSSLYKKKFNSIDDARITYKIKISKNRIGMALGLIKINGLFYGI